MAKFLNTRKAISELDDLIRNADEKLIFISPYLKLSKDFKELLSYRNELEKITTIIFGKQELNPDEMGFLESLRFVVLRFHKDLHAKCYLKEETIIITSLNLYEFSMANNKEMGILLKKEEDKDAFENTLVEIEFIKKLARNFRLDKENLNTSLILLKKQMIKNIKWMILGIV